MWFFSKYTVMFMCVYNSVRLIERILLCLTPRLLNLLFSSIRINAVVRVIFYKIPVGVPCSMNKELCSKWRTRFVWSFGRGRCEWARCRTFQKNTQKTKQISFFAWKCALVFFLQVDFSPNAFRRMKKLFNNWYDIFSRQNFVLNSNGIVQY